MAVQSCVASWAVTEESPVAEARVEAMVYILKLIESMLIMFLLLGGRLVRSGVIYWSQCVEGSVVVYRVYIGCSC